MAKKFRRISGAFIALLVLIILYLNIRLYHQPQFASFGERDLNTDLIFHLNYLEEEVQAGAGTEMRQRYPEGFVFLIALYGLTWAELAKSIEPETELFLRAQRQMDWAMEQLQSEITRQSFDKDLSPAYGIFYRGWSNYLLGRRLQSQAADERDMRQVRLLRSNCRDILQALRRHNSPFLESYPRNASPADMTVAMASVAIYNRLYPGEFQEDIDQWLNEVETLTDRLGLMPHSVNPADGKVLEHARGSSQSLILNFLLDINPVYTRQKFEIFKEHFLDYRLGLPGIREYPKGMDGRADIHSGPIFWDIGASASMVGRRVMGLYGEAEIASGLRNCMETFGLSRISDNRKYYLLGSRPIANVFIAWSNSVEAEVSEKLTARSNWRWSTHLISLLFVLVSGWISFRLLLK